MRSTMLLILLLFLVAGCSEKPTPAGDPVSPPMYPLSGTTEIPPPPPAPIPIPYPNSTEPPTTITEPCGTPAVYDWFAGKTTDVGSITVYNDGTNLYVTVKSTVGIKTLHGWVGTDPQQIPQQKNGGRVPPGQLPWQKNFDNAVTLNTWIVPLGDVTGLQNTDGTINDGKPVYLILHGALTNGESAYGGNWGLNIADSGSWWYFMAYSYQSCSGPVIL